MKVETNISQILDLMDRPAFCAENGVILEANQAAKAKLLVPGTPVKSLIVSGQDDYAAFSSGCLYLTLQLGGKQVGACITRMDNADLFSLDREDENPELRTLSLAAQELRQPLSQMLSIADHLFPGLTELDDPEKARQIALMNRSMHQMLRLVGNMSDAATAGISRIELRDFSAVVQEIVDHAAPLCQSTGAELSFTNHPAPIYTLMDSQKMERAVYNLLSNALRHGSPTGRVGMTLSRRKNTIVLTITNSGRQNASPISAGTFSRFLREPGIQEGRSGLGLGLTLVRSAAAAHQGALLLQALPDGGVQATLTFPIRQEPGTLHSPTVRIDYAGERDHGLIELSESLPPELFSPKTK